MVVEHDGVGCCQVDTESTSTRTEQEHKYVGSAVVLVVYVRDYMHETYRVCHSMTISRLSSSLDDPSRRKYLY